MHRLPAITAVFAAGGIDMNTFRTLVYRTDLITDQSKVAEVDRLLAARAARWPSMTRPTRPRDRPGGDHPRSRRVAAGLANAPGIAT